MVGNACVAAWQTAKALLQVLRDLPTTSGPIRAISDLFSEWYDIIKSVVRAAMVDLPLAWEIVKGPIPPGMHVLHRCDCPPCVRPDHLFLGTHADNMRDMIAKGRGRYGLEVAR